MTLRLLLYDISFPPQAGNLALIFSRVEKLGRCYKTLTKGPYQKKYEKKIKNAIRLSKKYGIDINPEMSKSQSEKIEMHDYYCTGCGTGFIVTAGGNITSCDEVINTSNPLSEIFFYGKIKKGKVIIDKKKIEYLRNRTVDNMEPCKNCFAKYHCLGGCLEKSARKTGSIYKAIEKQCSVNRNKFKNILIDVIK